MIAKKNARHDLEKKRSAFFTLGLLVTGSMTLAAFTYSDPMLKADQGADVERELIAVNYMLEPEKPVEKDEVFDLKVEDDQQQASIDVDLKVNQNITPTGNTKTKVKAGVGIDTGSLPTGPDLGGKGKIIKVKPGVVEEFVDVEAEFIGGTVEMMKFVQAKVEYPQISIAAKEQGKVYVNFVVERDGSITNIQIERGVSPELDREAIRVVKNFPKWKPAEKAYQTVRARVRLPINFVLD